MYPNPTFMRMKSITKNGFLSVFLFFNILVKAQVTGCTDPLASNYNSLATVNNGSCLYTSSTVTPSISYTLSPIIDETSGLIYYDNHLWTHNDNSDNAIYKIDTINGSITQTVSLNPVINKDWEEISQDSLYVYIGDFGNNVNGNRTDLHILRISKSSLLTSTPIIDTIYFSYSNQTNFSATGANQTDFDCEAFVVTNDSIFLFTKQWVSLKTTVYSLPKLPGTYSAQLKQTYNVQGLITGANLLKNKQLIVLSGYSNTLQPFLSLLYDYPQTNFFGGNKRKLTLNLPFHQIESITTKNGLTYYATNEYFSSGSIVVPQKLHIFDLSNYTQSYLTPNISASLKDDQTKNRLSFFPNPAQQQITITNQGLINENTTYTIINCLGETVLQSSIDSHNKSIDISKLNQGVYLIKLNNDNSPGFKLIKTNN